MTSTDHAYPESLGFKKLSFANWLKPDISQVFSISAEKWVEVILKPRLTGNVPIEIVKLFEVARGTVLYGWYFYPVCTLASEQLFRVQEAAVRHRCILAGLPVVRTEIRKGESVARDRNFSELVQTLIKYEIISAKDQVRWEASRKLRNIASHPKRQSIFTPGDAASMVNLAARDINALFAAKNPEGVSFDPRD